ncbi:hypothetical protein KUTeg_024348 [Tegillarca granosa]|uniref:Protein kinase domain-containing protein n=1 Tax=Tegillarca granosa TaxID=220873 RepID=A0ABQ9DXT5_TEGGR|nr:hypothetical protein KUTeg_024348 [Tegillarca granosa]
MINKQAMTASNMAVRVRKEVEIHSRLKHPSVLEVSCFNASKIADFGLATQLVVPDEKHFTMCGTPNYISP